MPLSRDEITTPSAPRDDATPAPQGSETILVVEDDESLRAMMRDYLQGKGYVVLDSGDPLRAIEMVADKPPRTIDLLLTDIVLPNITGVKLAEKIAASFPGIKVLYISGYTADAIVPDTARSAEFAFLAKPFSLQALGRKVRATLDAALVASHSRRVDS